MTNANDNYMTEENWEDIQYRLDAREALKDKIHALEEGLQRRTLVVNTNPQKCPTRRAQAELKRLRLELDSLPSLLPTDPIPLPELDSYFR